MCGFLVWRLIANLFVWLESVLAAGEVLWFHLMRLRTRVGKHSTEVSRSASIRACAAARLQDRQLGLIVKSADVCFGKH